MRPYALRPPVFGFGFVRRFSGLSLVISEKSDDVWNRRPALVGLRLRMGIPSAPEDVDTVLAGGEGDDRPLLARRRVVCPGLPVARALALAVDRVDLLHSLAEQLLDRAADLDLVRVGCDDEGIDVVVVRRVALLGDDRLDDDVARVFAHVASPSGSAVSLAMTVSSEAFENTNQSLTRTS